ncbi:MAG TPA: hypothetical protein VGZ00_12150 [Candidatus Baltobacteraceae bacterium]|nr:hypothetical protein [Candidatus Baltobacteraceae bacterium]
MNSDGKSGGEIFREAWIKGVTDRCADPKPAYTDPWEKMPDWERQSAEAVFDLIRQVVIVSDGETKNLTLQEKGQLVSILWNALVRRYNREPKESYIRPFAELLPWHQETDIIICEEVQNAVERELDRKNPHERSRKLAS